MAASPITTSGSAFLAFVPHDDDDEVFEEVVARVDPRASVFKEPQSWDRPCSLALQAESFDEGLCAVNGAIEALMLSSLGRKFRIDIMDLHEHFEGYLQDLELATKREETRRAIKNKENMVDETRARHLAIGIKKFNTKPKHGIEYFEQTGLLPHDAKAHAMFLRNTAGLFKTMIGEYLGQPEAFFLDVLRAFVNSFDFCAFDVDHSLREFLQTFRLPGEAQKIDRMMEAFAQRYHAHNPDVFSSADTVYVLSFALIMLNTDLHNPGVKNKMTLEQFFSTTRGIDDGADVDHALLERLYRSIQDNEITMEPDCAPSAFDNPDKEGYMRKQGGRIKTWKKRWFLLSGGCLYYFTKPSTKAARQMPKGIVPLENVVAQPVEGSATQFVICTSDGNAIKAAKLAKSAMRESRHEKFLLTAATLAERDDWLDAIRAHIVRDPYFELLRVKREALSQEINAHGGGRKGASALMARRKAATEMRNSADIEAAVDDVQRDRRRRATGVDPTTAAAASSAHGGHSGSLSSSPMTRSPPLGGDRSNTLF